MFLCGLKESTEESIVLHETSSAGFKVILKYAYSGKLELDKLTEEELMAAATLANQYQMTHLESSIANFLDSSLTVENVLPRFQLSGLLNMQPLHANCVVFMFPYARELLKEETFLDLTEVNSLDTQ